MTVYYAIGDIHGMLQQHKALLAKIQDHILQTQPRDPTIVYLGDLIDRGPSSRECVELAMQLKAGITQIYIKGNHEAFLLESVLRWPTAECWMRNGGYETLDSYGGTCPYRWPNFDAFKSTYFSLIPEGHRHFMAQMRTWHHDGPFFFCHAGIRPGRPLSDQPEEDLLWTRGWYKKSKTDWHHTWNGVTVVHGHSIVKEVDSREFAVNIDTGSFQTGVVTCGVFDTEHPRERVFFHVKGDKAPGWE